MWHFVYARVTSKSIPETPHSHRLPVLRKLPQPRSPDQIPRPARPAIDPAIIPIPPDSISEERKASFRIQQGQISIQDTPPTTISTLRSIFQRSAVTEDSVPLFFDESTKAKVRGSGVERNHVNAMDERECVAEVGCVVDLVLEEDAGDFVGHKARRLDGGAGEEVEVVVKGASLNCEHQVACTRQCLPHEAVPRLIVEAHLASPCSRRR
jgi:hypothetical protein